jgi:hypothetical protein
VCVLTGEAEQRLKRGHWRVSSVESECELVEVVGQVFPPHTTMGARQPCLQVGEDPVYSWQEFGRVLPCPLGLRLVVIALLLQGNVPHPTIRQHDAPGRGAQNALDEVWRAICTRPISTVLEADIAGYFDAIVRELLIEMIEKRVSDASILRLIGKWINVGVIEDGRLLVSETGTGLGQVISPLLANIYLHYVLNEWFEAVVKPRLKGEAYEIR